MAKGWHRESRRHSLARRGVVTCDGGVRCGCVARGNTEKLYPNFIIDTARVAVLSFPTHEHAIEFDDFVEMMVKLVLKTYGKTFKDLSKNQRKIAFEDVKRFIEHDPEFVSSLLISEYGGNVKSWSLGRGAFPTIAYVPSLKGEQVMVIDERYGIGGMVIAEKIEKVDASILPKNISIKDFDITHYMIVLDETPSSDAIKDFNLAADTKKGDVIKVAGFLLKLKKGKEWLAVDDLAVYRELVSGPGDVAKKYLTKGVKKDLGRLSFGWLSG